MNNFYLVTEIKHDGEQINEYVAQYTQSEVAEIFTKEEIASFARCGKIEREANFGLIVYVDMIAAAQFLSENNDIEKI